MENELFFRIFNCFSIEVPAAPEFGLQSTGWKDKRAIAEQIHHVLKQVGMETEL